MREMIYDEEELKWFYENVLGPLKPTEVTFISLSARNKYLSAEEKTEYELGRNEMFAKTIIHGKDWEKFKRTIYRFSCDERGYTTKNNKPIPAKATVCYININPSDTLKALKEFQQVVNEYFFEIANVLIKGQNDENILDRIGRVDNNLLIAYQKATGTKHWVDFDMDVPGDFNIAANADFAKFLKDKGISNYHFIDTKSGYHLLIAKNELKFNPKELVDEAYGYLTKHYYNKMEIYDGDAEDWNTASRLAHDHEIIQNTNAMIPVPGTLQGGYEVKVIRKP